ncbi:DUF5686 and carboxypeptidase regulatory-like domain-containing protein [Spirosoma montaniterrae]|uniref:Membrane receptor RagA n=1 Tax=Spirosoma montaniterrae TaxID=1178516 RepID=A0A1P9WYC9_9BACT|nr:DUF5686 and carboxypeptidase regulatory-like domain-containing protein [Spirosoma montaniterrae]AQG80380.1 hypothetical protein AWR27_14245 [Spirosoma montaniterrae]
MRFKLTVFFTLLTTLGLAQTGLRGTVKNSKGDAMPYAAIIVKGTSQGTISNDEGRYEIALPSGQYTIVFQYLGFQTLQKSVEVGSGFQTLDVVLEEQAFRLAEVQAKVGNEDPAYTIMRRAIAKSRFHQLQVQQYTARSYGKASFTVQKLPAVANLFKKQLAEAEREANFKVGRPILYESVAEISFRQPNSYNRRTIAARNSQFDQVIPSTFFISSFYSPKVGGNVSPLSPSAFAYYKFEYEGTFSEPGPDGQRIEISKIRVMPRSWGEGVFRGVVYIIENTWALHSFQLEFRNSGGATTTTNVRGTLSPVKGIWMPLNLRFDVKGDFFGADFIAQGVISQTYSRLVPNPAFVEDVPVIDEKKEKSAPVLSKRAIQGQSFEQTVKKQKELTTKNFKQLIKEYEKQEFKERKRRGDDVQVVRNDSSAVDSLAGKRSAAFWDSIRAVPLTTAESISYAKNDSLRIVREVKIKADSVKGKKKDKFSVSDFLLSGESFKLAPRTQLVWTSPLSKVDYNTVEGYAIEASLRLNRRASKTDSLKAPRIFQAGPRWYVGAVGRYQFGRNEIVGYGQAGIRFTKGNLEASGGRYFVQFNPNNPISPLLNSFTTLLFEQNFMKLYAKNFARLQGDVRTLGDRLTLLGSVEIAQRSEVANFKENIRPWINWTNRTFTPNYPLNVELPVNDEAVVPPARAVNMPTHNALTLDLTARFNLGRIRYRIRNGIRTLIPDDEAPVVTLNYRTGSARQLAGSPFPVRTVNYGFVQAGIRQSLETGIRSRLSYALNAGTFITNDQLFFPDFKHFAGNEFWFQQGDPVTTFRMLPYYQFSTAKRFAEAHVLGEFRKFALTQITVLRLLDLRENLFVNYLATPSLTNYTEVGYGLNGLIPQVLPFFRLEVIGQFQNGQYQGIGYRVGTTLNFGR